MLEESPSRWALLGRELGREAFPGLLQALLLLGLVNWATPRLGYLLLGPLIRREWYGLLPLGMLAMQGLSALVLPWLLARGWGRRSLKDQLSLRPVPWRYWPGVALGALGASLLGCMLLLVMVKVGWMSIPPERADGTEKLLTPLVFLLGAAVSEEFLFRGILLKGFLGHYPRGVAILLSALLFGAAHGNGPQFLNASLFGLFVGWVFAELDSLWPCMVAHALGNAVTLLPDRWDAALGLQVGSWPGASGWALGLVCLIGGGLWMRKARRDQEGT